MSKTEKQLAKKYNMLATYLDERTERMWCAAEAIALGRGGVSAVHRATGVSRSRINRGKQDFEKEPLETGKIRRKGGGRKRLRAKDETLLDAIDKLLEPTVRGDPMCGLRWTCKSTRNLAKELKGQGYKICATTVRKELKAQHYSLQGNRKTQEGSDHPDRDKQFEYIHATATSFQKRGKPVISIDTKKKENIGNYKNGGKEWTPQGKAQEVKVHDFIDKNLGKAIPYGVYDVAQNKGFVSVGIDNDTAEFAVETIRRWWDKIGRSSYADTDELYITADGGGSNSSRSKLFKRELQRLSDETGLTIKVSHYPPGTSKWNKIEHRMFCHITENWRGVPLRSREIIVELIAHTRTEKGLCIEAELDTNTYEKGKIVTEEELANLNILRDDFHGEWNYSIQPRISNKL